MGLAEEISRQAASLLSESQFIVDLSVSRNVPHKINVVIDGDDGVGIDDCANLSRKLSAILDNGLLDDDYVLEVSTPGVDQPLKLRRQYRKHIGRKMKVVTAERVVEGRLQAVGTDKIEVLEVSGSGKRKVETLVSIPFESVEKAFVLVSFK